MTPFVLEGKKIWIAGHKGLVGAALCRALAPVQCDILTVNRQTLDLRDAERSFEWLGDHKPDLVILAAAKVGGIDANRTQPVEFLSDNLAIQQNVITACHRHGTAKLVFLGSSCIYPRHAPQPITEDWLLTGPLEPTNEAYAIAKIAGVKLCQFYRRQYGDDFISVMPCNLYGPGDRWDSLDAHVIPALIARLHDARENADAQAEIWGSGKALREFLFMDDAAAAILHCAALYSGEAPINIGSGHEISIAALAQKIAQVVGFSGKLVFDPSMPDGTPRKLLDSSGIRKLGWSPLTALDNGLRRAYQDFLQKRNRDRVGA